MVNYEIWKHYMQFSWNYIFLCTSPRTTLVDVTFNLKRKINKNKDHYMEYMRVSYHENQALLNIYWIITVLDFFVYGALE